MWNYCFPGLVINAPGEAGGRWLAAQERLLHKLRSVFTTFTSIHICFGPIGTVFGDMRNYWQTLYVPLLQTVLPQILAVTNSFLMLISMAYSGYLGTTAAAGARTGLRYFLFTRKKAAVLNIAGRCHPRGLLHRSRKHFELKAGRGMALNLELAWAIQSEADTKPRALYILSTHYHH